MARWRVRPNQSASMDAGKITLLTVGVLAGLAAGAYVAHRLGGMAGISARVRRRWGQRARPEALASAEDGNGDGSDEGPYADDVADAYAADHAAAYETDFDAAYDAEYDDDEFDDEDEDEDVDEVEDGDGDGDADADEALDAEPALADDGEDEFASADPELEDRVLEAFVNDPVLAECPVDIGAILAGTIELTGAVQTREEYEHATTLARGVPGVETVVNRMDVREDESVEAAAAAHYTAGDPRYSESGWDGDIVGTGRRRQGTSEDVGRHEHPKVPLENRATSEEAGLHDAAEDIDDIAERRRRRGGGPGDTRPRAPRAEPESSREPPIA
jgi:BON domain